MEVEVKYKSREVLERIIRNYVSPYKKIIAIALFFMLVVALASAALVSIVEPAIDKIFISHDKKMLYILPAIVMALSVTKGIAEYFQNYLIKSMGQRILSDIQIELYQHLLKSDIEFVESQSSAKLISRFTNDISLMRGAVSNLLVGVGKHLFTVLFLIILMFKLEPTLSFVIFFIFPLAIYPIQRNGRKIRNLSYSAQEELGNYTAKLDETFDSIKVVKSYQAEDFESERAKSYIEHIYELYKKTAKFDALTSPIMETLSGAAITVIIVYGGYMIFNGQTTPGALFTFISAFVSAYRPYKSMVSFNVNLQESLAAATRLFKVLDNEAKIESFKLGIPVDCTKAEIEFKNVSLFFGEKRALNHLNFTIKPNSTIAIVGKSGEGKTSITNLLLRFYEQTSGEILINGTDINKIDLVSLRSQISLVTQDTLLFDASIAENISYSIPGSTLEKIISAAKAASAHEFILALPDGYDTIIGPKGRTLSGGQKQRLAIARAFLKNAPVLILDEATSSLDPLTEKHVQESLSKLSKNRTTIIVTHRLHTIEFVDQIYVVKGGKISEQGTHAKLIKSGGEYSKLYNKESDSL